MWEGSCMVSKNILLKKVKVENNARQKNNVSIEHKNILFYKATKNILDT